MCQSLLISFQCRSLDYTPCGLVDIKEQVECPSEPSKSPILRVQSDARQPFGWGEGRQLLFLNCQKDWILWICLLSYFFVCLFVFCIISHSCWWRCDNTKVTAIESVAFDPPANWMLSISVSLGHQRVVVVTINACGKWQKSLVIPEGVLQMHICGLAVWTKIGLYLWVLR